MVGATVVQHYCKFKDLHKVRAINAPLESKGLFLPCPHLKGMEMDNESPALDVFHWHETLDRTSMIASLVDAALARHPAVAARPYAMAHVEAVQAALEALYRDVQAKEFSKKETAQ
jgi:hypothetical protein